MITLAMHPIPTNEQERLQALLDYEILDTAQEEKFDDLVKLASQICKTPISLVSLIDHDRQWFKAKVGLGADQTPREQAFCAHAIMDDKPFIVQDATKDERFANNPLVTGSPDIRFYAGIPLKTPSGFNLGTLCVIDQTPRELDEGQVFALQTLANQVIGQMELSLKVKELQGALKEVNEKRIVLEKTIQDLKNTQSQLIESEKMASIGQLTTGIANEINNPINFISAGSQTLDEILQSIIDLLLKYEALEEGDTGARKTILDEISAIKMGIETQELVEDANDMMTEIKSGVNKAVDIITNLLEFTNHDEDTPEMLNINTGIKAGLMLFKKELEEKNINVNSNFDDLPQIQGYKYLLNQVFINLMTNAIDAVGENGTITVTTKNEENHIKICFEDSGHGIPKEHLSKIFEPFFTTKPVGRGAGLGLSVSYGAIQKHDGSIVVNSEEGKGCTFTITIPK